MTTSIIAVAYMSIIVLLVSKKDWLLTMFTAGYCGTMLSLFIHLANPSTPIYGWLTKEVETEQMTVWLLVIGLTGLCGLYLSYCIPRVVIWSPKKSYRIKLSKAEYLFWLIIAASLAFYMLPKFKLFDANYSYSTRSTTGGENVIPGIGVGLTTANVIMLYLCVYFINSSKWTGKLLLAFVYLFGVVFLQFLSGIRAEGAGFTLALVFYSLERFKRTIPEKKYKKLRKKLLLFLSVVVFLVFSIGMNRSGGISLKNLVGKPLWYVTNFRNIPHFNSMANSFLVAVYAIDQRKTDLKYGMTYLNLIPQTLPVALYPGRPKVPAQYLAKFRMTMGGAHLAGTAYMNFYIFGPFLVMFLLGIIIRNVSGNIMKNNHFHDFLYCLFFLALLRFLHYSELSLYKTLLVGIIVHLMISRTHLFLKLVTGKIERTFPHQHQQQQTLIP